MQVFLGSVPLEIFTLLFFYLFLQLHPADDCVVKVLNIPRDGRSAIWILNCHAAHHGF
jgi:hypothetical protein